jgi:hypothetical protein
MLRYAPAIARGVLLQRPKYHVQHSTVHGMSLAGADQDSDIRKESAHK